MLSSPTVTYPTVHSLCTSKEGYLHHGRAITESHNLLDALSRPKPSQTNPQTPTLLPFPPFFLSSLTPTPTSVPLPTQPCNQLSHRAATPLYLTPVQLIRGSTPRHPKALKRRRATARRSHRLGRHPAAQGQWRRRRARQRRAGCAAQQGPILEARWRDGARP